MLFPTVHRHASARKGAAIEFVQQEPLWIAVVPGTALGTYLSMIVAVPDEALDGCVPAVLVETPDGAWIEELFEELSKK
jgi:hypothetical protein